MSRAFCYWYCFIDSLWRIYQSHPSQNTAKMYILFVDVYSYGDFPHYKENALVKLDEEERLKLCRKVQKYASLDERDPEKGTLYTW